MSDVTYGVEVRFLTSGSLDPGSAGLTKLQSATDGWGRSLFSTVEGFGSKFNSTIDAIGISALQTGAAIGTAIAAGMGVAIKEGVDFNAYIESSVNGIAATLSMLGDIPLDRGLQQASKTVENLRQQAALLPGELKDAMGAFTSILPAGLNNGVEIDRLEKLAAESVAVAASFGLSQNVAGHELAAMLEGRARSSMPLVTRLGIHAKEWNGLSADTRFEKLEGMFGKLGPAMSQFQQSWAGLTSTARDNARNVAATFASPLFGSMKNELSKGLEWFGSNDAAVHTFAANLGANVDHAFHVGIDKIHQWAPAALTFAHTMRDGIGQAFEHAAPFIHKLESVSLAFMQDPRAFDKIERAAVSLAALRLGSGAMGLGSSGLEMLGGLGMGAGSLATAAPVAAGAILALGLAVEGATRVLADPNNAFHKSTVDDANNAKEAIQGLGHEFGRLENDTRPLRDVMGAHLVRSVAIAATSLEAFGGQLNMQIEKMKEARDWTRDQLAKVGLTGIREEEPELLKTPFDYRPSVKHIDERGINQERSQLKVPQTVQNFHGGIHIQVHSNEDPNRIARQVEKVLDQKSRSASRSNPMTAYHGIR